MTFFHNFNIFVYPFNYQWQNITPRKFDLFVDLDTEVVPRSFATHVSLCNTLPSNKLCPKTVKILVVKVLNYQKVRKFWLFFTILIFLFTPLTTNVRLLHHENLTFIWTWTLRWVPRIFTTHASLCNTLPSNKLWTKTVKIPVVKGLNYQKVWKLWLYFTILIQKKWKSR